MSPDEQERLTAACRDATGEGLLLLLPILAGLFQMVASKIMVSSGKHASAHEMLISAEEAAKRLGRDRKWLDRRKHSLPFIKRREGRGYDVVESQLDEWIRSRR